MILYTPAFAGLGELNPFTADWRSLVGAASPVPTVHTPAPAVKPASGKSWLDSVLSFADGAINFVDRNATKAVNLMDRYGQVKGKTKAASYELDHAYRRNILQTPRYEGDDWIPGIPNVALIGGGAGLLLMVLLMRKGNG